MNLYRTMLNLIYPQMCFVCHDEFAINAGLCENCSKIYLIPEKNQCNKCGKLKHSCNCTRIKYNFDSVLVPFVYKWAIREKLLDLKFKDKIENSKFFGQILSDMIKTKYNTNNINEIIFIPLNEKSYETRKYNQSEVLANEIEYNLKIPVNKTEPLIKIGIKTKQHELNFLERKENAQNIFKLNNNIDLEGKNILLIDDIIATGYTLDSCSKLLKQAGAGTIHAVVIASTERADI